MRQFIKYIVIMMILSMGGIVVNAASLSTSISGGNTVEPGGEFTLTFFLDIDEPIKQMSAKLNVDLSVMDIVSGPEALNGLSVILDENNIITVSSESGVSSSI